jgi:hypothetical protein
MALDIYHQVAYGAISACLIAFMYFMVGGGFHWLEMQLSKKLDELKGDEK